MVDFNKLIGSVTSSGLGSGLAGGVAGGAVVSALSSKSGRKAAVSVAKVGGLAAVGALAWSAYKSYQGKAAPEAAASAASPQQAPAPGQHNLVNHGAVNQGAVNHGAVNHGAVNQSAVWQGLPQQQFDNLAAPDNDRQGLLILRAMIAAAMADGQLGPQEQQHIFAELDNLGLSAEERGTLFDELRNPLASSDLAAVVTDPVLAIEVYTAARLTVASDCNESQMFLANLARDLNLPDNLRASIHSSANSSFSATA